MPTRQKVAQIVAALPSSVSPLFPKCRLLPRLQTWHRAESVGELTQSNKIAWRAANSRRALIAGPLVVVVVAATADFEA